MFTPLRSLVGVVFLLASCRSFDFERQQVFLRYQPAADVLDVVIVYEGVGARNDLDKEVAETTETLKSIGEGRRHFMIWDWPLDIDLEEMIEKMNEELGKDPPESELTQAFVRSFLEYQKNISVSESRFLVDVEKGGRLCLLQRFRLNQGLRALRLIDGMVNGGMLDEMSGEDGKVVLDPGSDALLFARAQRGGSWARFDGTELEVSIPMTPEQAALQLKNLLEKQDTVVARLSESLTSLQVTGEELRLRFAPAEDGWIAFTLADDERSYRNDVAKELTLGGVAAAGDLATELARLKAKP